MTHRYYRPELDVLRLIAFLLVFFTHRMDLAHIDKTIYPWRYNLSLIGVFGVPVFFLLSAFLITELLMRERQDMGTIHLKAFYLRRILRIWPLYFAVFFGLAALARFLPHVGATTPGSWLAFTFFSGNWYICKFGWFREYPVNPLWSISVEEQFYITIPLIALYCRRRGLIAVCLGLIAVAYLAIVLYAQHPHPGFSSQWTNSFVQFQFFAAGTLLSLALRGRLPQLHPFIRVVFASAAVGCWLFAFLKCGVEADNPHPVNVPGSVIGWFFVFAGVLLLFLSLFGIPSRYLPRAAVYLGRISYGLYLFHAFVLYLVFHIWKVWLTNLSASLHLSYWRNSLGTVIALTLTILIAMLSYHTFERPFLRLKKRFTFVPSRD
jgi:peptidoglycan/LPS O-acetylase OafA/YrhL